MVPLHLLVASALAWSGESNAPADSSRAAESTAVILDFTAARCVPCQRISPLVSKYEREGVPIRRVDVDKEGDIGRQFGIATIPAFVLLIDGKEVARSRPLDTAKGVTAEGELRRICGLYTQRVADATSAPRQPSRVTANSLVDLGEAAPLPKTTPQSSGKANAASNSSSTDRRADAAPLAGSAEKPSMVDRLLGRRKKEKPAPPSSVRAQNGAEVAAGQPVTPLSATVRLHVKDAQGENFGTGTIIDSRPGRTLILTCGHLFRQWKKGCQVHVDLFHGDEFTTIVGNSVAYELDEEAGLDLGLISINTDNPLPVCRVAPPGTKVLAGAAVASVGCGGGDKPTVQHQKITALNRYKGADNIECSAIPVVGRSGGGLFDREGRVIGVCMCADPHYRDGLYAGLKAIHGFLDRRKVSHVYRLSTEAAEEPDLAAAHEETPAVVETHEAAVDPGAPSEQLTDASLAADGRDREPPLTHDDVVGSEIMIIVNSKGRPGTPSKVVRLHRATRGFWDNLLPELDPRPALQETTLKKVASDLPPLTGRQHVRRQTTDRTTARATRDEREEDRGPEPFRRRTSRR